MNRKLVNGLLLLTVATGGVGTFTSCKDTESDFRNQVLVGQQDLSDQIAAIRNITDGVFKENLENKIKAAIDAAAEAGDWNKVKDLERQLAALQGTVTALQGTVAALDAAYKAADVALEEKLMGVINGEVATLNAAIEACREHCDGEFENIRTQLNTIESEIQDALSKANAAQTKANEAYGKAIANETAIETLHNNLTDLQSSVDELEGEVSDLKGEIEALKEEDTEIRNLVKEYKESIDKYISEVKDLQGNVTKLETTCKELTAKLSTLETKYTDLENKFKEYQVKTDNILGNIWEKLAHLITSIQLQRVVNPIFGGLDFPVGFSTAVLANYFYNGVSDVTFPNDDSLMEYGLTDYAKNLYEDLSLDLAAIGAPSELIKGNKMMLGSLGDVYVTLNPTANDFTGVRAKLVNSLDQTILDELVLEKDNETLFKFGYTRAEDNKNGLHRAAVKATDVEKAVSQIGLDVEPGLLSAFKDAIKDRTRQDFAELAKLLVKQFNNKFDAYALKVSWDDVDQEGKKFENSVISGYDIAATTFRPLSYRSGFGFTVDRKLREFSPLTEYFDNYFDELRKKFVIDLGLTPIKNPFGDNFTLDLKDAKFEISDESVSKMEITIDLRGLKVWGKDEEGKDVVVGTLEGDEAFIHLTYDPTIGEVTGYDGALNGLIDVLVEEINEFINGTGDDSLASAINEAVKTQILDQVNQMVTDINSQLTGIQGNVDESINKILDDIQAELRGKLSHFNRFVDLYNKIARKVNNVLEDPNGYLQVMAFYANANGPHHLSTKVTAPTVFKAAGGDAIDLFCTSYNAELIVPSYKKYVAITGVYDSKGNKVNADLKALNENNGSMNKIAAGNQHRFAINADKLEPGKVYEVFYQALDYRGYTSTRTYYITVKR